MSEPVVWTDLSSEAYDEIGRCNLEPLARLLESGEPVPAPLREALAAMIRGTHWDPIKLVVQRTGRGKRTNAEQADHRLRNELFVGIAVLRQIRAYAAEGKSRMREAAISEIAESFGISPRTARSALDYVEREIRGENQGFTGDLLVIAGEFPDLFDISANGTVSLCSK